VRADSPRQGLAITPALLELEADRGSSYNLEVGLLNDSDGQEYKIKTLLQGFVAGQDEGVPVVTDLPQNSPYLNWVEFKETSFTIKQGEKAKSNVVVSVPSDAQPGSHYLALTYAVENEEKSVEGQKPLVRINQRIAALLFLNVKGQVQRDVDFDFIQADKNLYDPFIDNLKVDYRLKVSGNAYFKPSGNIFIGNDSTNPEATLAINPEQKIIMPNSMRTFNFTNESISNFPKPWFGEQAIEARILFLNSQSELTQKSAKLKIYYFPWKTLLAISPVILLILILYYFRFRKTKIA
jgi:hypothetical protein